jgi:hypothetical protein
MINPAVSRIERSGESLMDNAATFQTSTPIAVQGARTSGAIYQNSARLAQVPRGDHLLVERLI